MRRLEGPTHAHALCAWCGLVEQACTPEPNTGCLLWTRGVDGNGYGRLSWWSRNHLAHVVAYEAHNGRVPRGREVHHRCCQPSCVNPDHLVALTPTQHRNVHLGRGVVLELPIGVEPPPGAICLEHEALMPRFVPTQRLGGAP